VQFNPPGYGAGLSLTGTGFLSAYGLDPDSLPHHCAALGHGPPDVTCSPRDRMSFV
jgi:hypothetical protein